jgi:hypothetical protein
MLKQFFGLPYWEIYEIPVNPFGVFDLPLKRINDPIFV